MFFDRRDEVHKTLRRLVRRLEKASISYAVLGGMAVFAHRYQRTTHDVDVLLKPAGFEEFRRLFVPNFYINVTGRSRRFVDKRNKKEIAILVAGHFPGSGKPGPVAFPDPDDVKEIIDKTQTVTLAVLVQLKLAARRHQDLADVVNLIKYNDLDESFLNNLHPSLHQDYIECLEEKRREDEYEAREG
jgi:hypothetical protein